MWTRPQQLLGFFFGILRKLTMVSKLILSNHVKEVPLSSNTQYTL